MIGKVDVIVIAVMMLAGGVMDGLVGHGAVGWLDDMAVEMLDGDVIDLIVGLSGHGVTGMADIMAGGILAGDVMDTLVGHGAAGWLDGMAVGTLAGNVIDSTEMAWWGMA